MKTYLRILVSALFLLPLVACDDSKPTDETGPATWTQVSAAGNQHYEGTEDTVGHTCALKSDGTLWCWGNGGFGQLGNGSFASRGAPSQVGTETDWIYVAAAGARTFGIRGSDGKGTLWAWGSNRQYSRPNYLDPVWGLLGLGASYDDVDSVETPTQVGNDDDWVQVGPANHSACGIRDDGTDRTLWCWGHDANGAMGDGANAGGDVTNEPTQESGNYTDWASATGSPLGYESNMQCGIRDDGADNTTIWCQGYGGNGLLAGGANNTAAQVGVDTDWAMLAHGGDQTWCAIKTDGTLYCASGNNHGQAGQGDFAGYGGPTQVGTDETWSYVNVGRQSVCGINDGKLYCWGRDHLGELGIGPDPSGYYDCDDTQHSYHDTWDCPSPLLVDDTHTWTSVSGGRSHTCGLTDKGDLYCWGNNHYGAVGDPSVGNIAYTPTLIE